MSMVINKIHCRVIRLKLQWTTQYKINSISNIHKRCKSNKSRVPSPTWSIKELNLTASTENDNNGNNNIIISDEELERLSKRCLISTSHMDEDERSKLKIELGNMMRCISLVTSFEFGKDLSQEELEERMYDVPRGFSSTRSSPLRKDDTDEMNTWRDEGKMEEAISLLEHLKEQSKLYQKDGMWYFSTPSNDKQL